MKKLFALCLFTMALFLGTQSISAQEDTRSAEEIAKEKTYKLSQEFGLEKNQHEFVFRAFLGKEKVKKEITQGSLSREEIITSNEKADKNFFKLMEQTLSKEQYFKLQRVAKEYF